MSDPKQSDARTRETPREGVAATPAAGRLDARASGNPPAQDAAGSGLRPALRDLRRTTPLAIPLPRSCPPDSGPRQVQLRIDPRSILDALAAPGADCVAVPWRMGGVQHLSVIVKASFAKSSGAAMSATAPEPIRRADVSAPGAFEQLIDHHDLAPYLPRGEIVLVGRGALRRDRSPRARLVIYAVPRPDRAGATLVDKSLTLDDQELGILSATSAIPLAGARRTRFGPLGPSAAPRSALLREGHVLSGAEGLTLGEEFPWEYFCAAPVDQRIGGFFEGTEVISLEGFSEQRLDLQLPGPYAAALVALPRAERQAVSLQLDTIRVDLDRHVCSLTWRGWMALPERIELADVVVMGGVGMPGSSIAWPVGETAPVSSRRRAELALDLLEVTLTDANIALHDIGAPFPVARSDAEGPPSTSREGSRDLNDTVRERRT